MAKPVITRLRRDAQSLQARGDGQRLPHPRRGRLSPTKFLLATDGAVDLRNFARTLEHVLARADFRTDLFLFANLAMDSLDYAGPRINEGSKGVLLGGRADHNCQSSRARCHQEFAPRFLPAAWSWKRRRSRTGDAGAHHRHADFSAAVLSDDAARDSSISFLWTPAR